MKIPQFFRMLIVAGLTILLISCGGGGDDSDDCDCDFPPTTKENGLALTFENQDEEGPANVSVLFKVEKVEEIYSGTEERTPVTDLRSTDVEIFENGDYISEYESQQAILPKPGIFTSHTLLLLDLSGSVLESESLPLLKQAARTFVGAMMPSAGSENYGEIKMGIWWFDGAEDIHKLISFSTDTEDLLAKIDSIRDGISKDSSTNLYGAIIQGIGIVEDLVAIRQNNVSIGSVVIFTDGNDQAALRKAEDALEAVNMADPNVSVYSIGLGGEIDQATLRLFGKDGFELAADIEDLVPGFEDIASTIRKDVKSHYLLEYCSPKRQGEHELKIVVSYEGVSGSLTTCFCADGFKGGCQINE